MVNRGIVMTRMAEYNKALDDFNAAIRIAPTNTSAYCGRGKALHELGNHKAAIKAYDVALMD